MNLLPELIQRSHSLCELCGNTGTPLQGYIVPPRTEDLSSNTVVLCPECLHQMETMADSNYWRCLSGSIWSEVPSVQVLSHKLLTKISNQDWAQEILDSVYPDEELVQWSNAENEMAANQVIHKDAYGNRLETGDSVVLIQNLNVKGTNYIAPKGTMVRKIRLVPDSAEQIEGKINGDTIVILTKFIKKSV